MIWRGCAALLTGIDQLVPAGIVCQASQSAICKAENILSEWDKQEEHLPGRRAMPESAGEVFSARKGSGNPGQPVSNHGQYESWILWCRTWAPIKCGFPAITIVPAPTPVSYQTGLRRWALPFPAGYAALTDTQCGASAGLPDGNYASLCKSVRSSGKTRKLL